MPLSGGKESVMKGKFTVLKLIGIILAGTGLLLAILGAVFGLQKYKIKPSDARNSVVWIYESLSVHRRCFAFRV